MQYSKQEIAEATEELKKMLKPGDTLYTILRHVSRSGMSRNISVYAIIDNEPIMLDWHVARALGYSLAKGGGIRVGGCGMDMGFHVVYSLSSFLFHGSFVCIGEGCPSNDHANGDFDRSQKNIGRKHSDGGYALKQRWM